MNGKVAQYNEIIKILHIEIGAEKGLSVICSSIKNSYSIYLHRT